MTYDRFLQEVSEMKKGEIKSFFISKTSLGGRDAARISLDIAKKCKYPVNIHIYDFDHETIGVLVEIL